MSNQSRRFDVIDTIDQVITAAKDEGIVQLSTEDQSFDGSHIQLQGQQVINFGSCSYLGLELHPALKEGVIDAVTRFGSQYSSSRAYISTGQYDELESLLSTLFGGHALVTATTTLGHISSLPVIIGSNDAVILDQQVHASVQTAAQLLKPTGITVELIKHNDLDSLRKKIEKLKSSHRRIWYLADGVYSMFGDYAPLPELEAMLEEYDQLHLYVDDAHGMSWTGVNGKGYALSQIKLHPKMILTTSLNKAFASAGGVLVFPNAEWKRRVRTCGGPLIFSGPIQPPMLGAAIASAKIHLSEEIIPLQQRLQQNVELMNRKMNAAGLPLLAENEAPIFFVAGGLPRVCYNIINRLLKEGHYVNAGCFPAVPMKRGGIRFTTTTHHSEQDITELVDAFAHHYPLALDEEGSSLEEVYKEFKLTDKRPEKPRLVFRNPAKENVNGLQIQYSQTIRELSHHQWDACFSQQGNFDWEGLRYLEDTFSENPEKESNWKFHYLVIKDNADEIVLATFLTEALVKDDMFSEASVSVQVEERREKDPYYLTSHALMMGSLATEGNHLFLNRQHPQWKNAVLQLTKKMRELQEKSGANSMLLRDFVKGADEELKTLLLSEGYVEMDMLDNNVVRNLD
ncbi:MAG: aminotransferase class I/II, partial [Moraxellaceae bacterium]